MREKSQFMGIFNLLIVIITVAYFLLALFFLIDSAFEASFRYGLRSLAACFLPLLVMIFASTYTAVLDVGRRNPNINLFIIYGLWTMMVLVLGGSWQLGGIPLIELLLSTMLATILRRTLKRDSAPQLYACCYGVVLGVLGFTSIFGVSPF